ncbi:MAG TPA: type II toxin-antitoxin system Phd/YefM family antitoxin [Solirubrobacterales bacterium]|nr:type II toxin-antitoxin system Phd/YefM family antitoxin [Solirubrobacterales bacterium]
MSTPLVEPAYLFVYPAPMAKTVPARKLRENLSAFLDEVSERHDYLVITRNGVPAAALISIEEYGALEETAEILSDPDTMAAIEQGLAEIERDETVPFDEVRKELAERRESSE